MKHCSYVPLMHCTGPQNVTVPAGAEFTGVFDYNGAPCVGYMYDPCVSPGYPMTYTIWMVYPNTSIGTARSVKSLGHLVLGGTLYSLFVEAQW